VENVGQKYLVLNMLSCHWI